jgi:hypothetical protein
VTVVGTGQGDFNAEITEFAEKTEIGESGGRSFGAPFAAQGEQGGGTG